jgi:hypothetical protein
MGKIKSHRSSLKMGAVIRKKAKAKRQREAKLAKNKQYPKRSKKILVAPKSMPNKEEIEASIHAGSEFLKKEIRPIAQIVATEQKDKHSLKNQMADIKAEIIRQYKENVAAAQQAFQELEESLQEADAFVEVVDARDPDACRYVEFEKKVKEAGKPLIIAINKCDLVPKDIAISWTENLRKEATNVVAFSAVSQDATKALLGSVLEGASKVAVFGVKGVGKSLICNLDPSLIEVKSITFAQSSECLCLLNAVSWQGPNKELAIETIARAVKTEDQPDLFSIYGIDTEIDSPEGILDAFSEIWKATPKKAGKRFVDSLMQGTQRFFCVPREDKVVELDELRAAALELSIPMDLSTVQYVQFAPGTPITVDEDLLNAAYLKEDEEEDGDEEVEEAQE